MQHIFDHEVNTSRYRSRIIDGTDIINEGLPESAPGHSKVEKLLDPRIRFIKLAALERKKRGHLENPLPFLPAAPSLVRVSSDEEDSLSVGQRDPSPLRQVALVTPAVRSSRSRYEQRLTCHCNLLTFSVSNMAPYATSTPYTGFQALILCGPGLSMNTFTSVPSEFPKALVQIANRPMVWYVLDWCYRCGLTDITLITPPDAKDVLAAALAQEPHLTSLPSPSPDLLAPADLKFETATAELLRLPEVQRAIKSDFVLLPCDLICDIHGESFLDTYLTSIGGLAGTGISTDEYDPQRQLTFGSGGESSGRRGGLSIWYNTANREESVKKEECDFLATVQFKPHLTSEYYKDKASNFPGLLRNLVWTKPMSDLLEEDTVRVRSSVMDKYGYLKCFTKYRDAHIYLLPYWVKEYAKMNEGFVSFTEDLVGTWAQSDWRKPAYREKHGSNKIFAPRTTTSDIDQKVDRPVEEEVDPLFYSTTQTTPRPVEPSEATKGSNVASPRQSTALPSLDSTVTSTRPATEVKLASRVQANPEDSILSDTINPSLSETSSPVASMPTIAAFVLDNGGAAPLVRRVDTTQLLLSVSLLLAKRPSIEEDTKVGKSTSSPFAHASKIHATASIAQQVTIQRSDCLVGANTTIATRCVIKNSVIGANVTLGRSTRITGSVVMDGATIGEGVELNGTVIGKKCRLGDRVKLTTCEVADGYMLADGIQEKDEKFMVGGLEADDDDELPESGDSNSAAED
jgi:translation initiation factor eIF-2B subunit gamma